MALSPHLCAVESGKEVVKIYILKNNELQLIVYSANNVLNEIERVGTLLKIDRMRLKPWPILQRTECKRTDTRG